MKALRYLLITIGLVSVLSIGAQTLAQKPETRMQSTSIMVSSGSALPQAAVSGAVVTGSTPGTYTPANVSAGPRKTVGGGSTADDDDPDAPEEPFPIGDAMIPLALLACAYLIMCVVRRRARNDVASQR